MNWRSFGALLARDVHVARRNLLMTLAQTMLQPLLFVFIFGRVMTASGMMPMNYKELLLPGVMAIAMTLTGIQAVAMPLIGEFQFTREIEDRLLAPIRTEWLAVEKVLFGVIQALFSGAMVLGASWLVMGRDTGLSFDHPLLFTLIVLLISLLSAAGGLTLGCSIGQTQIGLMFSLVVAPMIMFGCAYYPWSALAGFPIVQKLVLVNPLVYASEGLRAMLAPRYPHIPTSVVIAVLLAMDAILLFAGMKRFQAKAVS